jgi:hypothetical protein
MCRKHRKGADGDRVNAVLAATRSQLRPLRWFQELLRAIWRALLAPFFI